MGGRGESNNNRKNNQHLYRFFAHCCVETNWCTRFSFHLQGSGNLVLAQCLTLFLPRTRTHQNQNRLHPNRNPRCTCRDHSYGGDSQRSYPSPHPNLSKIHLALALGTCFDHHPQGSGSPRSIPSIPPEQRCTDWPHHREGTRQPFADEPMRHDFRTPNLQLGHGAACSNGNIDQILELLVAWREYAKKMEGAQRLLLSEISSS